MQEIYKGIWVLDGFQTHDFPGVHMVLLLLNCGETGGEPGRVLGSHVTHVLHTAGMQKSKQTNKQGQKRQLNVESIAKLPWDFLTLSLQIVARVRIQQNFANLIS